MDLEQLSTVVTLLVALSVAAERLVEIVKNAFRFLREENPAPDREGYRKVALQVLAIVAGIATALLAKPTIEGIVPGPWSSPLGIVALGLLASGGSGFWHSVAGYVSSVKDVRRAEAQKIDAERRALEV